MKVATDDNPTPSHADMCALVEKSACTAEDATELLDDRKTTDPYDDVTFKLSPVQMRMPLVSNSVNVAFEVAWIELPFSVIWCANRETSPSVEDIDPVTLIYTQNGTKEWFILDTVQSLALL